MDIINLIDIVSLLSTSYCYSVAQLIIKLHLTAVVTDGVASSVGLSVCHNMAQPIEMLFGVWSWVGPGNRVLDGGTDPGRKGAVLRGKRYLHSKCLAERARSTILLQRNPSFGQMPNHVHSSCSKLCWKVTKYYVHILWLTMSVYKLFEAPRIVYISYLGHVTILSFHQTFMHYFNCIILYDNVCCALSICTTGGFKCHFHFCHLLLN